MTVDVRDFKPTGPGMDLGKTITSVCPCGSTLFRAIVTFDQDTYEIAGYYTEGECFECGTRLTLPTEIDKEDYV
jgi:hypothetical protein